MGAVALEGGGRRWTARFAACPAGPQTRWDRWVGLGLFALAAGILGPMGALAGALLAAGLGGGPELAWLGGALPVAWLGWRLFLDLARRSTVYVLRADPRGLRIEAHRTGPGRWIPVPAAAGAVQLPRPRPAAVAVDGGGLYLPWSALRGVHLQPAAIALRLSADRAVFLAIHGHRPEDLAPLAERLHAACGRSPSGDQTRSPSPSAS